MKIILKGLLITHMFLLLSCNSSNDELAKPISLLSATINGGDLGANTENVPINLMVEFVFSSALNQAEFESKLDLAGIEASNTALSYANGGSKAILSATLNYGTSYILTVANGAIGQNGEQLKEALTYQFTTAEDDIIRSQTPCTAVNTCLRSVELAGTEGFGTFEFYSNYPIYEDKAEWQNLKQAVFVVHGASHNADDYYSYLANTLGASSLDESTVLIAPFFRNTATASSEDFYWSSVNYRDGDQSSNANKISSFEVIDLLIAQLADKKHFPVMEEIIITGQSSGGRFTHIYAAANTAETSHPTISFEYIVSENQYFYYPDGQRIDEQTNQLYTPTSCTGYDTWPFGYNVTPPYLSGVAQSTFNEQFVHRSIHYLLGSGTGTDNSLNTTACSANLLGSSRYKRGKNMFRYMELVYETAHKHQKTVVPGVIHNGSQIYQSAEFKTLLSTLLQ